MFVKRSEIKSSRQNIPVFSDDEQDDDMIDEYEYCFGSEHKTHIHPRPRPRQDSPIPQRSMFVSQKMELSRSYDGGDIYDGGDTQIDQYSQYSISTAPIMDMVPYISSTSDSCVVPSLPDEHDQKHGDQHYSDTQYYSESEYYPNDDDDNEEESASTKYEILKSKGPIQLDSTQINDLKENGHFLPITTDMDGDINEDDRWDDTFLIDNQPYYYIPFKDWTSDV